MTTTSTNRQFASATKFAAAVIALFGAKYARSLARMDGRERLRALVGEMERRARWRLEDGGIECAYDAATYGLSWVLVTGRLNRVATCAIEELDLRGQLKLIHELTENCQHQGEYAAYLMEKYSEEVA